MKLGERIKQLRSQAELTQPELAVKAGIEQSYLSKLENEKSTPSFDILNKIALAFDIDFMTLITPISEQHLNAQLGHIPEVAIKLEAKQAAKKASLKRGYIVSVLVILLGIAMTMSGNSSSIFASKVYQYESQGLIDKGETNEQFSIHRLQLVKESREEWLERLDKNASRIDQKIELTSTYKGDSYVEPIGEQRRFYRLTSTADIESPLKDIISIMGLVLLVGGGFGLSYVFKLM
ncbi:helix-turn-helix domain-containing protein [Thalassotalea ganghwensis]